jgi:hypothetical protein
MHAPILMAAHRRNRPSLPEVSGLWNSVRIRLGNDAAHGSPAGGVGAREIEIIEPAMTYSPRMRPGTRATRVSLQGRISVTILLENGRQLSAKLQQLSVTGGLLEIAMYLDERTKADLALPIGSSMVRPRAEMLFPMVGGHGYLQPFRFTRLWAEERLILDAEINEVLKQTVTRSGRGQTSGPRPRLFYMD